MDRLDEFHVLVTIVDEGSLAAAARRLRRSPPAITRVLASLEARTGARLLERTTRQLAPTEAGRALASRARSVLHDYADAMNDLASAPVQGLLRIAASFQFGRIYVAHIVSGFLEAYPDISIDLQLDDRNVDLIESGIDVAVRLGTMRDSGLMARQVAHVRGLVVVASPEYLARRGVPERPADLAEHDIIFATMQQRPNEWRFGANERGAVVRFSPKLAVNDVETQLIAARAGRGLVRLVSYQVAQDVAAGILVPVLEAFEPESVPVNLITPSPRIAPKVRAFLDYAADAFARFDAMREHGRPKTRGAAKRARR